MNGKGRLIESAFGYSMPVDAPLYVRPPVYYRDAEAIAIVYETDAEAARNLLPEPLELFFPPTASLIFARYPFSTLGPYEEVILGIQSIWKGKPRFYIPYIVVNSDLPMAAGREIWGFPKKMASILFQNEGDTIVGMMERPRGNRICSAVIKPETKVDAEQAESSPAMCLRVIPSPEKDAPPSLAELVEVHSRFTTLEMWQGPCSLTYHSASAIDPWHKLCVVRVQGAVYRRYHQELGHGRIVKRY